MANEESAKCKPQQARDMLPHETQSLILVCSERKNVIGMRKFWQRARLQVWWEFCRS